MKNIRFHLYTIRRKIARLLAPFPRCLTVPDLLDIQEKRHSEQVPNLYGALMMRGDLDILEEVMDCNHHYFQGIFVLDGTTDWQGSKNILNKYSNVELYLRDRDLGPEYEQPPKDGARQALLEAIQEKYGYDGFIVTLHSDEMFYDYPPTLLVGAMERYKIDALSVNNIPFFLHSTMREAYVYVPGKPVVEQVRYASFPGFSEFRIFKNKPGLRYCLNEHSRVIPHGVQSLGKTTFPLRHYLYRSVDQMRASAVDRYKRDWQGYGFNWMQKEPDVFLERLPNFSFAKYIPQCVRILNGESGEIGEIE